MTKAWGYVDCPYCNEQVELRLKLKKEAETKTVRCDNDGCHKDFVIRYHAVKTVDVMAAPMPDHMQPLTDEQRRHEGLFRDGKDPAITRESIRSAVEAMGRQDGCVPGLRGSGMLTGGTLTSPMAQYLEECARRGGPVAIERMMAPEMARVARGWNKLCGANGGVTIHESTAPMSAERMAELVSRAQSEGAAVASTRMPRFFEPSDWVKKHLRGADGGRVSQMEAENAALAMKNVTLDDMTRALRSVVEMRKNRGAAVRIEPRGECSMRVLKLRDAPEPQVEVRMDDRFTPPVEAGPNLIDKAVQAAPDTWGRITKAWSPAALIDDKED